jgi:two-component system, NtrC family, response regulator AtoC
VRRLGATRPRRFDVRFVAATNRDLEQRVADGRFRDDLYWRLHVLHVHLPPLRERPPTSRSSPSTSSTAAPSARTPWPSSPPTLARQRPRAAQRPRARRHTRPADEIRTDDLPPRIRDAGTAAVRVADASRRSLPLRDLERAYILEVLRQTGGNKSRAADILGLDRKTLYRKLDEYQTRPTDVPAL